MSLRPINWTEAISEKFFPYLASFLREIRFVELRIVPLVKTRLSVDFGPQKEDQGPTTGLPVILVIIVSPSQSACIFFVVMIADIVLCIS